MSLLLLLLRVSPTAFLPVRESKTERPTKYREDWFLVRWALLQACWQYLALKCAMQGYSP